MNDYFPLIYENDITYVRNKKIEEYDIKSAGYSITISENLITDEAILQELENADREEKQIILGNYAKANKDFTKALHKGFQKYIHAFITLNNIPESSVLSIKKDSVTFFSGKITKTKFKKAVFTKRGEFTSYLKLGKLVFLYNSRNKQKLVKGINLPSYSNTLIDEVFTVIHMNEFRPKTDVENYISELRQSYVKKDLLESYYRELSPNNAYYLNKFLAGYQFLSDLPIANYLDDGTIDITYNYKNIIMPLCKVFL